MNRYNQIIRMKAAAIKRTSTLRDFLVIIAKLQKQEGTVDSRQMAHVCEYIRKLVALQFLCWDAHLWDQIKTEKLNI